MKIDVVGKFLEKYPFLVECKHMFIKKGFRENMDIPMFLNKKEVEKFSVLLENFLSSEDSENLLYKKLGLTFELNNGLDSLGEKEHTLYLFLKGRKNFFKKIISPTMVDFNKLCEQWMKANKVNSLKKDFCINIDINPSEEMKLEDRQVDALLWDLLYQFYDWSLSTNIEDRNLVEKIYLMDQARSKVIVHKLLDMKENDSDSTNNVNKLDIKEKISLLSRMRKMNFINFDNMFIYQKDFPNKALNKAALLIEKIRDDFELNKDKLTEEYKEGMLGLLLLTHPSGVYPSFLVGNRKYLSEYDLLFKEVMNVFSLEEQVKYKVDMWYLNGNKVSNVVNQNASHIFWEKRAYFNIEILIEILKNFEEKIDVKDLLELPSFMTKERLREYVEFKKVDSDDPDKMAFLLDFNKFGTFLKVDKYAMQQNMAYMLHQILTAMKIDVKILQNNINNVGLSNKFDTNNVFFISDLRYYCYLNISNDIFIEDSIEKKEKRIYKKLANIAELYMSVVLNTMIDCGAKKLNEVHGKFLVRSYADNIGLSDISNRIKSSMVDPKKFNANKEVVEKIANIVREQDIYEAMSDSNLNKTEPIRNKRKI